MKLQELKKQTNEKFLLRGKSARGKTDTAGRVALRVADEGRDVKYIDTESEGASTLVKLIEGENEFTEDMLENVEYVKVNDYDDFIDELSLEEQNKYDLVIVDTFDHKHNYATRKVMEDVIEDDEDNEKMEPDWNMYPEIYSREREIMELVNNPRTNMLGTLDPDSGKMDKPKGCQTNIHGYFTCVLDLKKSNGEYQDKVVNWVGKSDWIDRPTGDREKRVKAVTQEIIERTEV